MSGSGEKWCSHRTLTPQPCRRSSVSTQLTPVVSSNQVVWREVPDHPGYRASSEGEIQTLWVAQGGRKGKIGGRSPAKMGTEWKTLRQRPNGRTGYVVVSLVLSVAGDRSKRLVGVHRLVCLAFHGRPPQPGMTVAHFPIRDRTCNRPDNLRWATLKDNKADCIVHGTAPRGERNPLAKLTEEIVRDMRTMRAAGEKLSVIAKKYNVTCTCVCSVCKRRSWFYVE
jgi:hypothetical protein